MSDTLTVGVDWQHFDDQDVVTVQVGATVPPACPRPRGMPDKGRRTRSVSMNANVRRVLWSLCEDRDGEDLVFSLRVSGRSDAEARSAEKPCFAGASHEGDDRNRTGVDGFAVRRNAVLSAYLSGFRGPQVLSGALKKRSCWESFGRAAGCAVIGGVGVRGSQRAMTGAAGKAFFALRRPDPQIEVPAGRSRQPRASRRVLAVESNQRAGAPRSPSSGARTLSPHREGQLVAGRERRSAND